MKIKWYDANICVPKKTGTYIVAYGESLLTVNTLGWSARHSGWNLSDDIMSRRNEICGIKAWAELPSIDEIRKEVSREE
jgi:hypothetical protein